MLGLRYTTQTDRNANMEHLCHNLSNHVFRVTNTMGDTPQNTIHKMVRIRHKSPTIALIAIEPYKEVGSTAATNHNILLSTRVELQLKARSEMFRDILYSIYRYDTTA